MSTKRPPPKRTTVLKYIFASAKALEVAQSKGRARHRSLPSKLPGFDDMKANDALGALLGKTDAKEH